MLRDPAGNWVGYAEYAALQAEVDKWQGAEHAVCNKLEEICKQTIRLQAENERLRKAGDDMAWALMGNPTVEAWLAAKGVQS